MKNLLITTLLLTSIALSSLLAKDATKESNLPKVLLIGDSISIGYTKDVTKILEGKAVVKHHKGNAEHTRTGLKKLNKWVGGEKWDVIHFNWGLWDLCYRHKDSKVQGQRDKVNGNVTITIKEYEKNLDELVGRLKKTGAKLIWAHTTVIPEDEAGRIVGDAKKYNDVASKIMKKYGATINDLHSLTKAFPANLFKKPGNVHFSKDGYQKIAEQVADSIQATLENK